ncbi:MAG: hypothetical protein HC921_01260 [Synechococcaceae cyanobacterium SM2_3_1]|nr:hypothetical protein [Synechococcaceae cyanobacterium SM2_3_1]
MAIEASVWLYWLACSGAGVLLRVNWRKIPNLLSSQLSSAKGQEGYTLALTLGWGATLVAAITYILFTQKESAGDYQLHDLVIFSLLNGSLEQLMFISWFLLGCWLGNQWGNQSPSRIFGLGFLSYALYSAAIHALFWVNVLPQHQPAPVMPIMFMLMSVTWMWLFWRYRAIFVIMSMHIVIDFLTVGHLHFSCQVPSVI